MNQLYSLNCDQYIEAVELAISRGKKAGESIEKEIFEIIKKYNIPLSGHTELNLNELKNELESHGNKVSTIQDLENKKEQL